MIITDYRFPQAFTNIVTSAAYHVCDNAHTLPSRDLVALLSAEEPPAVGVLTQVHCKDGDFQKASFEFSRQLEEHGEDRFHCFVPIKKGYGEAAGSIIEAARRFWVEREASRFVVKHGRILGDLDAEDLNKLILPSYMNWRWNRATIEENARMCSELARRELLEREKDSGHSKLAAYTDARVYARANQLKIEKAVAWWQSLNAHDRKTLPDYELRELPEDICAYFAHREFEAACFSRGHRYFASVRRQTVMLAVLAAE